MPFYNTLDPKNPDDCRTALGLIGLRAALEKTIPGKTLDDTLLVASWNLREFGGKKFGGRTRESLYYVAEVIDHFDLVAVQEVREDLDALDKLMSILGRWWKYVVTDVTAGVQGNRERLAFIYDTRKLSFGGLAGELAPEMVKHEGLLKTERAFARSPYMVGFQAGWFKFSICTGHLYYGESKPDDKQRLDEMKSLVSLLQARINSRDRWGRNMILLGDFNIFSEKDETFGALAESFTKPVSLTGTRSNLGRDKAFDQLVFLAPDVQSQLQTAKGDVFDYYQHVYREEDFQTYGFADKKTFKNWRTYQMSDHLPIWVQLNTDFGIDYLQRKAGVQRTGVTAPAPEKVQAVKLVAAAPEAKPAGRGPTQPAATPA